jgi:hypothetical protein
VLNRVPFQSLLGAITSSLSSMLANPQGLWWGCAKSTVARARNSVRNASYARFGPLPLNLVFLLSKARVVVLWTNDPAWRLARH